MSKRREQILAEMCELRGRALAFSELAQQASDESTKTYQEMIKLAAKLAEEER